MYSKIRVLSRADSKNGRLRNTIKINSFRNTRIILYPNFIYFLYQFSLNYLITAIFLLAYIYTNLYLYY